MVTLHGAKKNKKKNKKKQPLPVFRIAIDSLDGKTREKIEVTGSKMSDFTTIRNYQTPEHEWHQVLEHS